jgi:RNase P subunit RPR2
MKERDEQVSIDADRNQIFVPGSGNLPMIGLDRKKLDAAEKKTMHERVQLQRMLKSLWQCTECKQKLPGSVVKVKKVDNMPAMVCPECSGPVIVVEDALSLTKPPRG